VPHAPNGTAGFVAGIAAVGLATTACSTAPPAAAPAAAPVSAPASTPSAAPLVLPAVLDVARIDACTILTDDELRPVTGAIDKRKPTNPAGGPACLISPADLSRPSVSVLLYPHIGPQPDRLYDSAAHYPYFARTAPISGYPAVHSAQGSDGPQTGECGTAFSASPVDEIEVYVVTTNDADPHYTAMCTMSDQLARDVITNAAKGG